MRRTILAAMLWLWAVGGLAGADLTGTWEFRVELNIGSGTPTFTFRQEGEDLTGTYQGAGGTAAVKGKVKGNEVEFEFTIEVGESIRVRYQGTLESADAMKGTADYGGQASGSWTARRVKGGGAGGGGAVTG